MAANELGFTRARLSTVGAPRLTAPAPSVLAAPAASRMLIARLSVGQPDRIVWPKRRAVSARDGAVLAERVKSLIPVLPWQTGYSYYNNYSSRPLGEQSGGHKELEARDRVSLDETTALGRIRDFGAGDAASATDRAQPVTGRFGRYGADGVTLQEVLGERHGLWSFAARDEYGLYDAYLPLAGRQNFFAADTATLREWSPIFKPEATDGAAMEERAQQHGLRVYDQRDPLYVSDYARQLQGRRSIERSDRLFFEDRLRGPNGTAGKRAEDALTLGDEAAEQHGRRIQLARDDLRMDDAGYQRGGKRVWLRPDPLALSESGEQHGRRNWSSPDTADMEDRGRAVNETPLGRDGAALGEAFRVSPRPVGAGDQFPLGERAGTLRDGLRSDALTLSEFGRINVGPVGAGDELRLTEQAEQHGRRVQQAEDRPTLTETTSAQRWRTTGRSDALNMEDRGLDIRGRRAITGREPVGLGERVLPFRFEWRERVTVADSGEREVVRRDLEGLDGAALAETGHLAVAGFLGHDPVALDDAGTTGAFRRELSGEDDARLGDTAERRRVRFLDRDSLGLGEDYVLRGRLSLLAQDPPALNDTHGWQNASPLRQDTLALDERALELRGRRLLQAADTVSLRDPWTSRRGRMHHRAYDGAGMRDRGGPRYVSARDTVDLRERGRSPVSEVSDYVLMADSYEIERNNDVIRFTETFEVRQMRPRRADALEVHDDWRFQGTLDQKDRVRLGETRELGQEIEGTDAAQVADSFRLFKRSDFLEIRPEIYEERPGRLRSAASLTRAPDGSLWAVWIEDGQLWRARRPYPDSWRTHSRLALPAPDGSRRTALVWTPEPTFVTQVGEVLLGLGAPLPGVDPVSLDGELVYLTPDRRTLVRGEAQLDLQRRSYLRQSFSGGVYTVDDLERPGAFFSEPPTPQDLSLEAASARWEVGRVTRAIVPIEGSVIHVRD